MRLFHASDFKKFPTNCLNISALKLRKGKHSVKVRAHTTPHTWFSYPRSNYVKVEQKVNDDCFFLSQSAAVLLEQVVLVVYKNVFPYFSVSFFLSLKEMERCFASSERLFFFLCRGLVCRFSFGCRWSQSIDHW